MLNKAGFANEAQVQAYAEKFAEEVLDRELPPPTHDTYDRQQWKEAKPPTQFDLMQAVHYCPWDYSSIFMISSAVAQLDWAVTVAKEEVVSGESVVVRQEVPDCACARLFKRPDYKKGWTWYDLMEATFWYLEPVGQAFWFLADHKSVNEYGADAPPRILVLRPDKMAPKLDSEGSVEFWAYNPTDAASSMKLPPQAVVQFQYFNLLNEHGGLGSSVPAWDSIQTDRGLRRINRKRIDNHFEGDPVIEIDKDMRLTPRQLKELQKQVKLRYTGPNKAAEPRVLPPGAKLAKRSGMRGMQYKDLANVPVEEIAAATGTPAALMGKSSQWNRANVNAILFVFYSLTVIPKTVKVAAKITSQVVPYFNPREAAEQDMQFGFEYGGVQALQRDPVEAAKALRIKTGRPIMTVNEARESMGLAAIDQDDCNVIPPTKSAQPVAMSKQADEEEDWYRREL
jgi:hypothetical protein